MTLVILEDDEQKTLRVEFLKKAMMFPEKWMWSGRVRCLVYFVVDDLLDFVLSNLHVLSSHGIIIDSYKANRNNQSSWSSILVGLLLAVNVTIGFFNFNFFISQILYLMEIACSKLATVCLYFIFKCMLRLKIVIVSPMFKGEVLPLILLQCSSCIIYEVLLLLFPATKHLEIIAQFINDSKRFCLM